MTDQTGMRLSAAAVLAGVMLIAFGAFGIFHFKEPPEKRKASMPPSVPAARTVLLSTAANIWPAISIGDSQPLSLPRHAQPGQPLIPLDKDTPLTIAKEDGHLKVSVLFRDRTGKAVAELVRNEWKRNPNNTWDRNYTPDSVEVRDSAHDIVLQVKALADRLQLQAKLHTSTGQGIAIAKGLGLQAVIVEPDATDRSKLAHKIEPLFRYPGDLYPGQLLASETLKPAQQNSPPLEPEPHRESLSFGTLAAIWFALVLIISVGGAFVFIHAISWRSALRRRFGRKRSDLGDMFPN